MIGQKQQSKKQQRHQEHEFGRKVLQFRQELSNERLTSDLIVVSKTEENHWIGKNRGHKMAQNSKRTEN